MWSTWLARGQGPALSSACASTSIGVTWSMIWRTLERSEMVYSSKAKDYTVYCMTSSRDTLEVVQGQHGLQDGGAVLLPSNQQTYLSIWSQQHTQRVQAPAILVL